jgi:hypothetical protein
MPFGLWLIFQAIIGAIIYCGVGSLTQENAPPGSDFVGIVFILIAVWMLLLTTCAWLSPRFHDVIVQAEVDRAKRGFRD